MNLKRELIKFFITYPFKHKEFSKAYSKKIGIIGRPLVFLLFVQVILTLAYVNVVSISALAISFVVLTGYFVDMQNKVFLEHFEVKKNR